MSRDKKTIRAAILTVSDRSSQGKRDDRSGPEIEKILGRINAELVSYDIIPDDKARIKRKLISLCRKADLIVTTGGTGVSPRDVTPDATLDVIEKEVPGIAETMRLESMKKTRYAMISRAVSGIRGRSLIINLPGSPGAVRENLRTILSSLPHAIEKIRGDTSECAVRVRSRN